MKRHMETCKKIGEPFFSKGLKGPLTDLEMQEVVDFYLKNRKDPGPDKFQSELIKTMPPEQIRVLQQWLNEVLARGEMVTKVTEKEMTGKVIYWGGDHVTMTGHVRVLLHKGGSKTDQVAHCRPVVLLNITNQLIAYDINDWKLYDLT